MVGGAAGRSRAERRPGPRRLRVGTPGGFARDFGREAAPRARGVPHGRRLLSKLWVPPRLWGGPRGRERTPRWRCGARSGRAKISALTRRPEERQALVPRVGKKET